MTEYRNITAEELTLSLFDGFSRFQEVKKCWRRVSGQWKLVDAPFTEDWDEDDLRRVLGQLKGVLDSGGTVWGAFEGAKLIGFASVSGRLIGSRRQYAVLEELHVSNGRRRMGLGRELFMLAAGSGRALGAGKLYISAMSAQESQAFYRNMGCVEAREPDPRHVEKEPCDVQMEYIL